MRWVTLKAINPYWYTTHPAGETDIYQEDLFLILRQDRSSSSTPRRILPVFMQSFEPYHIEQLYPAHPLLLTISVKGCTIHKFTVQNWRAVSHLTVTAETGTCICRVIFKAELKRLQWVTERISANSEERRRREEREGMVWWESERRKEFKRKSKRHKTGIKPEYCPKLLSDPKWQRGERNISKDILYHFTVTSQRGW